MRELFYEVLEFKGHTIIGEAPDGNECIKKLNNSNSTPDFVIMDHRMPIMNGVSTMKKILDEIPDMKFIFVSADDTAEEDALNAGAVMFIKKPFDLQALYSSIDHLSD
jgi:CheY-like chemotaxis protein